MIWGKTMNDFDRKRLRKKYLELIKKNVRLLQGEENQIIRDNLINEISFLYGKYYEETDIAFTNNEGVISLNKFLGYIKMIDCDCNFSDNDLMRFTENALLESLVEV